MTFEDTNEIEAEIKLDASDISEIENEPKGNTETKKARKKRSSSIASNYDPTPNYLELPSGFYRPDPKCWVSPAIARPLDIAELHYLYQAPLKNMGEAKRKERFLASKLALVAGDYWIKDRGSGRWVLRRTLKEVKSVLMLDWGRNKTRYNIRKETIDNFLSSNEFITLEGFAYVPGGGDFVDVRKQHMLNTYHEYVAPYERGIRNNESFHKLCELIVYNLLGHQPDQNSIEDHLADVFEAEATDIKWLFHWLASQYQRPGKYLPTALWFIGKAQGVGKGLFTSGLGTILGTSNVKTVSAEEFQGPWTDFLMGSSLLVLDEIDFSARREVYDKIKRLIGNETASARKRYHGDNNVPSVANFIFTTNNTTPLVLDSGDRRNTFFLTRNKQDAKDRASAFYRLGPELHKEAWQGMAEFLASIPIDDTLISKAFNSEIKDRMIASSIDPVLEWLLSDQMLRDWHEQHFAPTEWLYPKYKAWMNVNDGHINCRSSKYFNRRMGELNDEGYVSGAIRKTLKGTQKYRGYVRHNPEKPEENIDAQSAKFIEDYRKDPGYIAMRDRARAASKAY